MITFKKLVWLHFLSCVTSSTWRHITYLSGGALAFSRCTRTCSGSGAGCGPGRRRRARTGPATPAPERRASLPAPPADPRKRDSSMGICPVQSENKSRLVPLKFPSSPPPVSVPNEFNPNHQGEHCTPDLVLVCHVFLVSFRFLSSYPYNTHRIHR